MGSQLVKFISTFGYIGYFPAGPGTLASAAGAVIALYLQDQVGLTVVVFGVITVLGFLVSDRMEQLVGHKDPSCVVIDEVSGIMIAYFMLPALTWPIIVVTFFLFRAFDMFKIYPVNKFEDIKGGTGVMMDDIIAGIYTNLTMQIAIRLTGIV